MVIMSGHEGAAYLRTPINPLTERHSAQTHDTATKDGVEAAGDLWDNVAFRAGLAIDTRVPGVATRRVTGWTCITFTTTLRPSGLANAKACNAFSISLRPARCRRCQPLRANVRSPPPTRRKSPRPGPPCASSKTVSTSATIPPP